MLTTSPSLPKSFFAGDTVEQTFGVNGYSPSEYTCTYGLPDAKTGGFTKLCTSSGANFVLTITSAESANINAGLWAAFLIFTRVSDSARFTELVPSVLVYPNPATERPASWARTTLAAAEAAIAKIASKPNASVSVGGQTYTKQSLAALMELRDELKMEIQQESMLDGRPNSGGYRTIRTRFVNH